MKTLSPINKLALQHNNAFAWLCALQFVFWTFVPFLIRDTLNHDVLEGLAWGFEFQLGYDKHPPLTAWLLSAWLYGAQALGVNLELAVYALAQLVIIAAFYPVYRLSLALLPYKGAVIATTLLTGILFFNTRSMNLTPDTMQTPIWAWSVWMFYLATTHNKWRHWLGLAVISALALWAKYSGIILIFSEFMVLVLLKPYRHYLNPLKNPKVYVSVAVGLLLFAPHVYWLVTNDFLPLQYAKALVVNPNPALSDHVIVIFKYLATQVPLLILPVLMLCMFYRKEHKSSRASDFTWTQDMKWVAIIVLTPFIVTILQSVITGQKSIGRWSTPYYSFMGILMVFLFGKIVGQRWFEHISEIEWRRYTKTWVSVFFMILAMRHVSYYAAPYIGKTLSDVYYPTKTVTQQIEQIWSDKTHQPLQYIIGDRYWTTFVSVYAKSALPSHPHVFLEANSKMSPWINVDHLNKTGGMIIWLARSQDETTLPPEYANLPRAQFVGVKAVPKNLSIAAPPLLIGIGWIPPLS